MNYPLLLEDGSLLLLEDGSRLTTEAPVASASAAISGTGTLSATGVQIGPGGCATLTMTDLGSAALTLADLGDVVLTTADVGAATITIGEC